MTRFKYAAVGPDGRHVSGEVEGSTVEGVADSLARQGLQVRAVAPVRRSLLQLELTPRRVKPAELSNFSRQMAAFVSAGVPLLEALAVIESEAPDKRLRKVAGEVADSLRFGESFSAAMAHHRDTFPPFYLAVLQSVEATGDLAVVLAQLARYIDRDLESKRKIRAALTYPSLVMLMSVVTVGILGLFVLPRFKSFFESFDADLPTATRLLLSSTEFFLEWWAGLVAALFAVVAGGALAVRSRRGKVVRDRVVLRVPVIGDVVRHAVIERFCRVLGSIVEAGVPIPEALRLATISANNTVYERALLVAQTEILQGEGIARPIARTKLFSGTVTQMVRVGENTGTLDQQLEAVARYYEQELEYKLKRLTNLFEPISILVVGLVVGFVAVALVSAIYGIYNQVELR